jgi:hypothetical protein
VKQKTPLVFKIESELHERLEECAKRTKQKKYSLGIMAIEAAVEAIEKNDYRLVVPIKFEVTDIPASQSGSPTSYPSHRPQTMLAEDGPDAQPAKKPKRAA